MRDEGTKPWWRLRRYKPALDKWEMLVIVRKKDREARTPINGELSEEREPLAAAGATEREDCCQAWWMARTKAERKSERRHIKELRRRQKCGPCRISVVKISAGFVLPATWMTLKVLSWTHSQTKFLTQFNMMSSFGCHIMRPFDAGVIVVVRELWGIWRQEWEGPTQRHSCKDSWNPQPFWKWC